MRKTALYMGSFFATLWIAATFVVTCIGFIPNCLSKTESIELLDSCTGEHVSLEDYNSNNSEDIDRANRKMQNCIKKVVIAVIV